MKLTEHPNSTRPIKMLFIGECLSGDTIISAVRSGILPRKITIKQLYSKFHGIGRIDSIGKETHLLSDVNGYIGRQKVLDVVKSGKKELFEVTVGNYSIKSSKDHQFKMADGEFKKLENIVEGEKVIVWKNTPTKEVKNKELRPKSGRITIYSIPYHPYAFDHWIGARNYKRHPKARIVLEAAMNGLELNEFIQILRKNPEKSAELQFLEKGMAVHHLDGDCTNDDLSNLQILTKQEHDALHHEEIVKASQKLSEGIISSIKSVGMQESYDIMMEGPHHNFLANGIVVHNSGNGKTGALASLISDGYKIRMLDYDNGVDIIRDLFYNKNSTYKKEKLANFDYITLTEKRKNVGGVFRPLTARVWEKTAKYLEEWPDEGKTSLWDDSYILVLDSLTRLSECAYYYHLAMNNKLTSGESGNAYRRGIGVAQDYIRQLLGMLYSEEVKFNVIINAHVKYVNDREIDTATLEKDEETPQYGFPKSIGAALSPEIPSFFNSMLQARTEGKQHRIYTRTQGKISLKTSAPLTVKEWYPLETGLADYFFALKGKRPE